MVDAQGATLDVPGTGRVSYTPTQSTCEIRVCAATPDALQRYAELAGDGAVFAPAQSPAWVSAWVRAAQSDALLVLIEVRDRPVMGLALEVVRTGPFRIARLMGGRHANANFPPLRPGAAIDMDAVVSRIAAARPDVDLLELDRLVADCDGVANPLLTLPHVQSPNPALAVEITEGFEALLRRSGSMRKRKKHRAQARELEAAGGYRRIEASTPEEVARLFDAFLAMKASRFREAGIPDVFAPPEVQRFFATLFTEALPATPKPFVLHGLEVGGRLRAVTGSSRMGDRITCEFGAIANDELAQHSPGDFLFFQNIEEACAEGLRVYDFGVGDEPYKRSWCDIEIRHWDVMVPLAAKGRLLAAALRQQRRLVEAVKRNPRLWRLVKVVRRSSSGLSASARDPD